MARVSKKVSAAQREAENALHRVWKTAIYARLSDFDDVLRDSESLEVQISYIKEYINPRDDLMLLDVFAYKRCTGMNFDRPEFERLLKALQERKINCIVVKDFSRLGRNFVETGQYLEQVFPLFGVRFIAINDNYDSLNSQSRDPMSFKVPDRLLTDGQCRMMINGIQFIQVLLEANGLAAGKDHQFKGRYDAEKNAVIISLEKDEQSALSPQKCTT